MAVLDHRAGWLPFGLQLLAAGYDPSLRKSMSAVMLAIGENLTYRGHHEIEANAPKQT